MDDEVLSQMPGKLGCKAEKLSFLYFRTSLGRLFEGNNTLQLVIDRVHKKLDREKKRFNISRGWRQTLCKSVLANLPTYYLSLFAIPDNVVSSLEKLMRNFLWEVHSGSKINHLATWNKVTLSQLDGGLGLGGIKIQNTALLAK